MIRGFFSFKALLLVIPALLGLTFTSPVMAGDEPRSIIIYFDYIENIGDTSGMEVDALTAASRNRLDLVPQGNLRVILKEVRALTGADVFSLRITEPYARTYKEMYGQAVIDQRQNRRFSFEGQIPDLNAYDRIFIGSPVWSGGLPQPVLSFMEQHRVSGKDLYHFVIHSGSGFGQTTMQIRKLWQQNRYHPGFSVRSDVELPTVMERFNAWAGKSGLKDTTPRF